MKRLQLFFIIVLSCIVSNAAAQQSAEQNLFVARPAIGAFGNIDLNMAHANFSQLPGVPDCNALYQSGTGIGPSIGIFYELPIQEKLSFLLRGAFSLYGEKLTSNELAPIAVNGVETSGTIEHSITATLGMIGIQPMANYHILPALSLHLGAEIGFVISSSFSQIETITSPTTSGVFDNGLRTRNPQAGKIPNANSVVASLLGGVSYQLPLNSTNTLQLVPEISYTFGLTPVAKNITWSVNSFRGGTAIRYEIPEAPIVKPSQKPIDTIPPPPPPPPLPIASITALGIETSGEEVATAYMRVEEIYSIQMIPLLPYIFFEPKEKKLPERYVQINPSAASSFSEMLVKNDDALTISHHTLNILGKRLTDDPQATVAIAGITLRSQIDNALAQSRAEEVASYLKSVWHISDGRIHVSTHPLAKETISAIDTDGISEANRVEITSNSFTLLQPVMGSDTIRSVTPPTIRFHPSVQYNGNISHWNLSATQDGKLLKKFEGTSVLPGKLDWILADDQLHIPRSPGKLDYHLSIIGSHGDEGSSSGSLPVEQISLRKKRIQKTADREIEKYNLLLFDLQSSEISQTNKQTLELIQKSIKNNSTISIVGHTDRTGDTESNKRLSLERAKSTAKALGVTNADVRGIANETILYDNTLPEGRSLSRTVDIIIETPTETQ